MAVVQEFTIEQDHDKLEMAVDLVGDGTMRLTLRGQILRPCRHGLTLQHTIVATVECSSDMELKDMELVEAMIRGDLWAARQFGIKIAEDLAAAMGKDPCEPSEEAD